MVGGKKGSKKPPVSNTKELSARTRKLTGKQKRALAKKEAHKRPPVIGSLSLIRQSLSTIRQFWKPLLGIILVYLILDVIFAGAISNIHARAADIRLQLQNGHSVWNILSSIGSLMGNGPLSSQTTSLLQLLIVILGSLVIIWALRHLLAAKSISVKQAYYQSMTPLIPFVLVLAVIFIQLLPPTLGAAIINAIVATVVNSTGLLTVIFILIFTLLALWSVYMISSSIFALYIVTLPEMQPLQALRSAKNLVKYRRWQILRRLIFLPLLLVIAGAILIAPFVLYVPFLAVPLFYILGVAALLFAHTYIYSLYRSLIE